MSDDFANEGFCPKGLLSERAFVGAPFESLVTKNSMTLKNGHKKWKKIYMTSSDKHLKYRLSYNL